MTHHRRRTFFFLLFDAGMLVNDLCFSVVSFHPFPRRLCLPVVSPSRQGSALKALGQASESLGKVLTLPMPEDPLTECKPSRRGSSRRLRRACER